MSTTNLNAGKLVLTINLDDVEVVPGEGKHDGYVFINNNKGRFSAIEARAEDGSTFFIKTCYQRPEKPQKAATAAPVKADAMADALNALASAVGNINARLNDFEQRLPLKAGRKGVAAPGISALVKAK